MAAAGGAGAAGAPPGAAAGTAGAAAGAAGATAGAAASPLCVVVVSAGQGGQTAVTVQVPSGAWDFVTVVGGGTFVLKPLLMASCCPSGILAMLKVPQIILISYGMFRAFMALARSASAFG